MARGRMIDKCISTSEKFALCPDNDTRLLYLMLIPHADDFGRMDGKSFWVKGAVVPMIDKFSTDKIDKCLDSLCGVGLIRRGEVEGKNVIEIDAFDEHQSGLHKRTKSKFPSVPGISGNFREFPKSSALTELNRTELNRTEINTFAQSRPEKRTRHERVDNVQFENGKIIGITEEDLKTWGIAYPAVDLKQQIAAAEQWLVSNPTKKKKLIRRFLTGWFSRKQERGGNTSSRPIAQNSNLDDLPWLSPYWNPKGLSKGDWSAAVEAYAKSQSLNPYRLTKEQKKEAAEYVRSL